MTNTALKVAAIVVIVVMIASIGVYATISFRNGFYRSGTTSSIQTTRTTSTTETLSNSSSTGTVYTIPFNNGTVLVYKWLMSFANSTTQTPKTSNATVLLSVSGTQGPWIKVNLTYSSKAQPVEYPYGSLFLPKELLGRKEVKVPLYTGLGRTCMILKLKGEETLDGKYVYIYKGSLNQTGYSINITIYYSKDTGIALREVSRMIVFPLLTVYAKVNITMDLINVTKGKGSDFKISIPSSFVCWNGASTYLSLTATGVYEVINGTVNDITDFKLKESLNGFAFVAVLDKECPHCRRFWPVLLQVSNVTNTKVFVVVISQNEIMSQELFNIVRYNIMASLWKTGNVGFPFFGVFKNGTLVTYRLGEQTLSELESFISNAKTHIAK